MTSSSAPNDELRISDTSPTAIWTLSPPSRVHLGRGLSVSVASLRDVSRSKEAAGRDKDLAQLPLLRRTLEQIRER
jgi:hypothetical protein